jgi:hypothetical protein
MFGFQSVVIVLLAFLLLRGRATGGGRLVVVGIILALEALWFGLLTNEPDHRGAPFVFSNPALADGLLKLAAVMILGGIVTGLLTRDAASVPPALPERPRDVPPSV